MQKYYIFCFIFLLLACSSEKKDEVKVVESQQDTIINKKEVASQESTTTPLKVSQKVNTQVDKNYLLGKFDFRQHPDFVKVEAEYTNKYGEAYLRKEAYLSFKEMAAAAQKEGIKMTIISAARNFYKQKDIWENKWNSKYADVPEGIKRAEAILKFSAMPSTSRHHWGTDMDLNSLENAYFQDGQGKKLYEWLLKNAWRYGFCNVYSAKGENRPNGYNEEKWHWSYKPLANAFLMQYKETITLDDITGFEGAETKTDLNVIQNYVEGINPACK